MKKNIRPKIEITLNRDYKMQTSSISEDFNFIYLEKADSGSSLDAEFNFFLDEYSQALPPPGDPEESAVEGVFLIQPNAEENGQDLHGTQKSYHLSTIVDNQKEDDSFILDQSDEENKDESVSYLTIFHPEIKAFTGKKYEIIFDENKQDLSSSPACSLSYFAVNQNTELESTIDLNQTSQTHLIVQTQDYKQNIKEEEQSDFCLTENNPPNKIKLSNQNVEKKEDQVEINSRNLIPETVFKKNLDDEKKSQGISINQLQAQELFKETSESKNPSNENKNPEQISLLDQSKDRSESDVTMQSFFDRDTNLDSLIKELNLKEKKDDLSSSEIKTDPLNHENIESHLEPDPIYTEHSVRQDFQLSFENRSNLKTPDSLDAKEMISQLTDRVEHFALSQKNGKMTIHLEPENLGTIVVNIRTRGDLTETDIRASHLEVCKMLDKNSLQLQQSLESKGLSLDSFTVSQQFENQNHQQGTFSDSRQETTRQFQLMSTRSSSPASEKSFIPTIVNTGSESGLDYRI